MDNRLFWDAFTITGDVNDYLAYKGYSRSYREKNARPFIADDIERKLLRGDMDI